MKTANNSAKTKTVASAAADDKQKEPTVSLVLTAQQFNIIMAGLGELPHKAVGQLIAELVEQVKSQVNKQKPGPQDKE